MTSLLDCHKNRIETLILKTSTEHIFLTRRKDTLVVQVTLDQLAFLLSHKCESTCCTQKCKLVKVACSTFFISCKSSRRCTWTELTLQMQSWKSSFLSKMFSALFHLVMWLHFEAPLFCSTMLCNKLVLRNHNTYLVDYSRILLYEHAAYY